MEETIRQIQNAHQGDKAARDRLVTEIQDWCGALSAGSQVEDTSWKIYFRLEVLVL